MSTGGCRAGYRSAEDLASTSFLSRRLCREHAAGGTAGGSADDRILLLAAADEWSRTSTFQFLLVVECATLVFKVLPQNRVQEQRFLLQNAFLSGLRSRSSTFLFPVEAFKIFAQDRVHPHLHALQLIGSTLRMRRFKVFFALFTKTKKVRQYLRTQGSELPPHSSPWTPAAYDVPMALEEEEEESEYEPVFDVEYVEFEGRW